MGSGSTLASSGASVQSLVNFFYMCLISALIKGKSAFDINLSACTIPAFGDSPCLVFRRSVSKICGGAESLLSGNNVESRYVVASDERWEEVPLRSVPLSSPEKLTGGGTPLSPVPENS